MTVDLHRVRRTTADHPNTPADHRHLLHSPQLEVGWTVRLTTAKSFALDANTSTGAGVIQLDGLLTKVDHARKTARLKIFWLMQTGLKQARFRRTPVVPVVYEVAFQDIEGLAGHPPTIWDARSTETLKDSARRAGKQHQQQKDEPSAHWSELGSDL